MDKEGKFFFSFFAVICCGLVYSLFVILMGPGEETTNLSQVDGLHVVGFGKKTMINLINCVS